MIIYGVYRVEMEGYKEVKKEIMKDCLFISKESAYKCMIEHYESYESYNGIYSNIEFCVGEFTLHTEN